MVKDKKSKRNRKVSLNQIKSVASTEFIKWIHNPRMVIMILLFIFVYDYIVELMINAANEMNTFIMCLEPFIAMSNSKILMMIIPAIFMLLISDFPSTDGNTMFYIQRVGKLNWMIGQILFVMYSAFTYLSTIIVGTIILSAPSSYAKNSWSMVVTSYGIMFENKSQSRISQLIGGQLYNNLTPLMSFGLTFLLMFLYLVMLALMLMFSFAIGKRILGILISYMVIGVGSAMCGMNSAKQWLFPSAHAISWLHFDEILNIEKFSIKYSVLYFVVGIMILFVISCIAVKRYDFSKVTDMED